MVRKTTVSRRTPEIEDIFSVGERRNETPGVGTYTAAGADGCRTPDLDEILHSDVDDGVQRDPKHENITEHRGMPS